ncbi:hypothetical protein KSP35_05325 [Aquihabitans sp. G128]|uniref:hypothetical protein n=1 Tax=Aquihabitans sp. G128 TaxID=2849779 RepID=UPI001C227FCC|nr:hypothetical protein [Aquihabitans sp. G128]QXC62230.1 hypothetical protein KSP35_05325 [Aquihabitans sp. G128]
MTATETARAKKTPRLAQQLRALVVELLLLDPGDLLEDVHHVGGLGDLGLEGPDRHVVSRRVGGGVGIVDLGTGAGVGSDLWLGLDLDGGRELGRRRRLGVPAVGELRERLAGAPAWASSRRWVRW